MSQQQWIDSFSAHVELFVFEKEEEVKRVRDLRVPVGIENELCQA